MKIVLALLLLLCSCSSVNINQKVIDIFHNEDELSMIIENTLAEKNDIPNEIYIYPSQFDTNDTTSTNQFVEEVNKLLVQQFYDVDEKVKEIKDVLENTQFDKVDEDKSDSSTVISFINKTKNIKIYFCEDGFIRIVEPDNERKFYQINQKDFEQIVDYSLNIAKIALDYFNKFLEAKRLYN